jgi:hypothetical protein
VRRQEGALHRAVAVSLGGEVSVARERTRDLVDIFNENQRRWKPRWKDLPRNNGSCYTGDVPLDEELIRDQDTDEESETDE